MKIEIPEEQLLTALQAAVERVLTSDVIIDRVANAICQRFELLEPAAAAELLGCTTRTLADNHVAWGLDKSVAYGASNPRYFLTQVLERARARVIRGKRPKIEGLPSAA